MFDQRLFNQDQGLESGFQGDDTYDLYDKPLFATGRDAQFKATGGDAAGEMKAREFAKEKESDPFGLDAFLSTVNKK